MYTDYPFVTYILLIVAQKAGILHVGFRAMIKYRYDINSSPSMDIVISFIIIVCVFNDEM